MGYHPNTPVSITGTRIVSETYESTDLDITNFSFNPDGTCAFTLRFNRDGARFTKDYNLTGEEFQQWALGNLEAIQRVRAGCFEYLQTKGEIPSGTDNWPGA